MDPETSLAWLLGECGEASQKWVGGGPKPLACWQEAPGKKLGLGLFWDWAGEGNSGSLGMGPLGHSYCPSLPTP